MKNLDALWPVLQALAKEKKLTALLGYASGVVGIVEPMLADPQQAQDIENLLQAAGLLTALPLGNQPGT